MTVDQFNTKLAAQIEVISQHVPLGIAAGDTHALMMERIFVDGLNASGSKIGSYSTSPGMYVNTQFAPQKKAAKGKTGETKFKNGKPHKTTYFESYKAFRQAEGRESSFVNLRLFGNLQNDLSTGLKRVDDDLWIAVVRKNENWKKIQGFQVKYGNVFSLTKDERSHFKKVLDFELKKVLNK